MPKFYLKTVAASYLLGVLTLAELNLVRGVDLDSFGRKLVGLLMLVLVVFIILNEKATTRERWRWHMWLVLFLIAGLSAFVLF